MPSATATTLPALALGAIYAGHSFTLSIPALVDSVVTELRFVKVRRRRCVDVSYDGVC